MQHTTWGSIHNDVFVFLTGEEGVTQVQLIEPLQLRLAIYR